MNTLTKSYMGFSLFLDIFHVALPESLNLMATASLMVGHMLVDLSAAETSTGVLAFKAGLTLTYAAMMFYRGLFLAQQASETEQSINSMIQLLDLAMS